MEILLQPREIHITPNRGNHRVCIRIITHVGTGIHSVISLRLPFVQLKHQRSQVPHIFPYIVSLTRITKYHYN